MAIYPGLSDRSDYLREIINRARDGQHELGDGYTRHSLSVAFADIERLAREALDAPEPS